MDFHSPKVPFRFAVGGLQLGQPNQIYLGVIYLNHLSSPEHFTKGLSTMRKSASFPKKSVNDIQGVRELDWDLQDQSSNLSLGMKLLPGCCNQLSNHILMRNCPG